MAKLRIMNELTASTDTKSILIPAKGLRSVGGDLTKPTDLIRTSLCINVGTRVKVIYSNAVKNVLKNNSVCPNTAKRLKTSSSRENKRYLLAENDPFKSFSPVRVDYSDLDRSEPTTT